MVLLTGIVLLIPIADFVALLVTVIWLIVASVMLFMRSSRIASAYVPAAT